MPTMAGKVPLTPQALALKALVEKAGGPRKFVDKFKVKGAEEFNDPTFVSQVINGHRAFRDVARRNMARRAGLPENYFETITETQQPAKEYEFKSDVIEEAVALMRALPRAQQLEALGAIKLIASQHAQNSRKRAGQ
jgi:hypothetical protein